MEPSTATSSYGLDPSRIRNSQQLDDILQQVTCSICQLILWKPVSCSTCKSAFCQPCLTEWLQCSANKKNTCPCRCQFTREKISQITRDILSQLQISCVQKPNGCTQTPSYEDLEKHESTCGYQKVVCKGCNKAMLMNSLREHENACEEIKIVCLTCRGNFSGKGFQMHDRVECTQREFVKFRASMEKQMALKDEQMSGVLKENNELKRKVDLMKNEMGTKISSLLSNMQHTQKGTMLCEKNKDYKHNFVYDRKELDEITRTGKVITVNVSCGSCEKAIKNSESYLKCRNCAVAFCKKCVYEYK